jgi:ankyrin repeat protein
MIECRTVMTLNPLNPQAPAFVPSVDSSLLPCPERFVSYVPVPTNSFPPKCAEDAELTVKRTSGRKSSKKCPDHYRREKFAIQDRGKASMIGADVKESTDLNAAIECFTTSDNRVRKTSLQIPCSRSSNVDSAAANFAAFRAEQKKTAYGINCGEISTHNLKSHVRDRKSKSRKKSTAELKYGECLEDQRYSCDRGERRVPRIPYDNRSSGGSKLRPAPAGALQNGPLDHHQKRLNIMHLVDSMKSSRNCALESNCAVSFISDAVRLNEQDDHFPHLSGARLSHSKLIDIETLQTTKAADSSVPRTVSISYLDLAKKSIDDKKNIKIGDDCQSILDVVDSSWYFSSKEKKTNLTDEGTSHSSITEDANSALSLYESDQAHLDLSSERGAEERVIVGSGQAVTKASSHVSDEEVVASRSRKTDAHTSLIQPGSKSAADRWKGRWLEIARQQSALQKARQQLRVDAATLSSAAPKDWHQVLSEGLEQSVPYSHLYSNAPVPAGLGKERGPKGSAAAPTDLSAYESCAESAPTQLLRFRWWTAVLTGDHAIVLDMLTREKVKSDLCFCYTTYLADCRSAVESALDLSNPLCESATAHLRQRTHPNCINKDPSPLYTKQDQGFSAIHICAKFSHPVLLDHMLRATTACGADYRDRASKLTALHLACEACNLECAKILLLHGADPECRDKQGDTALHKSLLSTLSPIPQLALVTFLCERSKSNCSSNGGSLKLNSKNRKKETALMYARTRDLAVILIGAGADPMCVNSEGLDAASLAARRGDARVLEAILGCNSFRQAPASSLNGSKGTENVHSSPHTTALHEAARVGTLSCVRVILAYCNSKDLNRLDTPGQFTALMVACAAGHPKVVQELLNAGADPDVEDRRAVTAIVLAAGHGHLACVLAVVAARPHTLENSNSLGESVLEMIARMLAQDLLVLHPTYTLSVAPSSSTSCADMGLIRCRVIEQSLPCIVELIMRGAVVTERFVRRFSSSRTSDLFKLLKLSRHEYSKTQRSNGDHTHRASAMTFEVKASLSIWQVLQPSSAFCDVNFQLEYGHQCSGHSFVVSAESAVLKAMLSSAMIVRVHDVETGNAMMTISLPHHSKETFSVLLNWMYEKADVTESFKLTYSDDQEAIITLLYLANELLVTPLQRMCEHAIGKHIDCFDKQSVLSLCLSLDLQILLTYFDRHYPLADLLSEDDLDFSLRTDLETFWDVPSEAPAIRTEQRVGSQGGTEVKSAGVENIDGDHCWAREMEAHSRRDIMDNKSINDFIRHASDYDWCRWLSDLPSSPTLESAASCSQTFFPSSFVSYCSGFESSMHFGEESLLAYWFLSAVQSALSAVQNSDSKSERQHAEAVLQSAQSHFCQRCSGLSGNEGERRDGSVKTKAESVPGFDYTSSSKSSNPSPPPPPPPPTDTMQSCLRDLSIDERVKTMLGNYKNGTVSINLLADSPFAELNEDGFCIERVTCRLPSITDTLDAFSRDVLECNPSVAFNPNPSALLSSAAEEVALSRHREITPTCMLLQQQRAALLRDPDNSQFDVVLVVISPTQYRVRIDGLNSSRGKCPQFWDTSDNSRHIPFNIEIAREGEDVVLAIPAHRAILSVASGKLSAMIHFAVLLEGGSHSSNASQHHVSVLEIRLEASDEVCSDLQDLIWFAYTGVLRGEGDGSLSQGAESSHNDTATEAKKKADAEVRSARLLRLLWLSDEYLMPSLTRVVEHLMLKELGPSNAAPFFMGAQALGLRALSVTAGLCVLYSMDAAKVCGKNKHGPTSYPSTCEVTLLSKLLGDSVTNETDPDNNDCETSTALVLLEILRTLSNSETK